MPDTVTAEAIEIDFTSPQGAGGLVVNTPTSAVPAPVQAPSAPVSMLDIIDRASRDPSVDIDKLERLIGLKKDMEAREAQIAYDAAMTKAQEEIKRIVADKDNSHTKSQYASYAALDRAIRPIYTRHGFSVTFTTVEGGADVVRLLARIAHRGGHREEARLDMPADGRGAQGGGVMTKTHATGSAITYGKRYLSGMIWNLAIGEDDDGNGASDDDVERAAPADALRGRDGKLLGKYASDKAKAYTRAAIETINLSANPMAVKDWRSANFKAPKGSNISPLAWLEFNAPSEFQRVKMAYENVTGEEW